MKKKKLLVLIIFVILIGHVNTISFVLAAPGDTTLVSVASDGTQGDNSSYDHSISADGRFIAFGSTADNLVDGETYYTNSIFIHDRQTGETSIVSVASDGTLGNDPSFNPSISADGRFIAFESIADDLVDGDTNGNYDIFVHDRQTGETSRVSVASDGTQGNSRSIFPSISADGRFIAFDSSANNLVDGDTNNSMDIFVNDRQTGETSCVSVASDGTQGNKDSWYPSISADGRFIAFGSHANNLVDGDTNNYRDIFVHDRQTGETSRVSVASDGTQGNSMSRSPSISADGRFIAFESSSNNLVDGDTNNSIDIFVHDRQTGETSRVSVASDGTQGESGYTDYNYSSPYTSISADGRFIAFGSHANNLVDGDTNGKYDIFVHDRQTGETSRVSVASDGTQGNSRSIFPSISADGRFIAFVSYADNLVDGDTNSEQDIFVHEVSWDDTPPVPTPPDQASWLLMFYIAADNNLAPTYEKIINYLELSADNDAIDILVLWDNSGKNNSSYYYIKYDADINKLANYSEGVDKWSKGELNMGDPSTLSAFLAWSMDNFEASHYALIMDDHGSGLGGSMKDDTSDGDILTLNETKIALESVVSSHQKLDVLIMNACLMGLVEDGYQFKNVADYYAASEDIQWTYYQGYTAALGEITTSSSAINVASAFVNGYADNQINNSNYYTMSVVDLSKANIVKTAIEDLSGELNFNISLNALKLWNIRQNLVQKFPSQWAYRIDNEYYIDLYHFAQLVYEKFDDQSIKDTAQDLMTAINDYVIYNSTSLDDAYGVSIFFPDIKSSYYAGDNYDFADGTNWSSVSSLDNRNNLTSDPIGWGNLLVNIFQEVDPEGPDNPYPPEPLPKTTFGIIYLPIIMVSE